MAFNPLPTALIPSWSENGTNVTFPIASLPELTAAEADAVDGDSRKIIYALMERLHAWYSGITPAADKPSKLTVSRSSYIDEGTGNIVRTYTVRAITAPSGVEVVAEG